MRRRALRTARALEGPSWKGSPSRAQVSAHEQTPESFVEKEYDLTKLVGEYEDMLSGKGPRFTRHEQEMQKGQLLNFIEEAQEKIRATDQAKTDEGQTELIELSLLRDRIEKNVRSKSAKSAVIKTPPSGAPFEGISSDEEFSPREALKSVEGAPPAFPDLGGEELFDAHAFRTGTSDEQTPHSLESTEVSAESRKDTTHREHWEKLEHLIGPEEEGGESWFNPKGDAVEIPEWFVVQKQALEKKGSPVAPEEKNAAAREAFNDLFTSQESVPRADRVIERVQSLRGEEAAKRFKEALDPAATTRETSKEFQEKSLPYAERMFGAEKAYTDALTLYHKKRTLSGVVLNQFVSTGLPKEVAALRTEWMRSRGEYAAYLRTSAEMRHLDRGLASERVRNRSKEEVLERYQRRFVLREVVLGAEESELAARERGLANRERGTVSTLFEKYKALPPQVRILGTAAVFTAAGFAATGGGAFALIPLALGSSSAIARFYAETGKNESVKKWLGRIARVASIGSALGLVGEGATKGAHAALGTRRHAEHLLKTAEGRAELARGKNLADESVLENISKKRRDALTVDERIARQARNVRILSSLAGGAVIGHSIHEAYASGGGTGHGGLVGGSAEHPVPATGLGHEHVPTQTFESLTTTAHHGDGGIRMFKHLQDNINQEYLAQGKPIPEHLWHVATTKPEELAKEYGFYDPNAKDHLESALVKDGSTLGIDSHGSIIFTPRGGVPESLYPEHAYHGPMLHAHGEAVPVPGARLESGTSAPSGAVLGTEETLSTIPSTDTGVSETVPVEMPATQTVVETASQAVAEHAHLVTNAHGLSIDTAKPAVYFDTSGKLVAYGNDFKAQLAYAKEYVRAHHGDSVFVQAPEPVPVDGKMVPWIIEVKYRGIFRGVGTSSLSEPANFNFVRELSPDTFVKRAP